MPTFLTENGFIDSFVDADKLKRAFFIDSTAPSQSY